MTNYISNYTPTSSLSGWSKTGGSLTATADGARWTSSSSSDEVNVITTTCPNNTIIRLAGMQIRRNTAASSWPSTVKILSIGGYSGMNVDLRDVDFPVGQWITIPTISCRHFISSPGTIYEVKTLYVTITGPETGSMDCTFRNVRAYNDGTEPADAIIDSNDTAFTYTQPNNSFAATFTRTAGNESTAAVKWTWGDGTTTSGPAAGSGQKNTGVAKTYSSAGVRTVKLESTMPPRVSGYGDGPGSGVSIPAATTVSSTQNVTVPIGTFQAGYTYQVDYPTLLVDGSSSVAPSLSPITTYAWNWGDGTTGTGITATHVYAAGGTYNVTLTISNSSTGRTSSVTKTITLSSPPEQVAAPQFQMGLFFDDPAAVTGATSLQMEMVPILLADDIRWNWTRNEVPTLSFTAPSNWLSSKGVTLDNLKSDIVVRLNYGAGWVEPPSGRMIVGKEEADPLNPQTRVRVSCVGIAQSDLGSLYFTPDFIGTAYTDGEKAANYSRLFKSANAGTVLTTLLPVATTPGSGGPYLNFLNRDFSATVDSSGDAWVTTLSSFQVAADDNGIDLLGALIDNGAIDWYCQGNLLRVFNNRQSGKRGLTDPIPELVPGRDIKAAPQTRTMSSQTWGALVVSDKGAPRAVADSTSSSPSYQQAHYRGRHYVVVQADGIGSTAEALAVAKPTIAEMQRAKNGELQRELKVDSDQLWMPYRDYHVGDTVYAPGPDGAITTLGVESITIGQDSSKGITASLILGNAFAVNSLVKKMSSLSGGSGVSVGSVSPRTGTVDRASRRLTTSGGQSIANATDTVVALNASDEASGITYDTTANEFTIPTPGWYSLKGTVTYKPGGTTGRLEAKVTVNGTNVAGAINNFPATSQYTSVSLNKDLRLDAGDKVKLLTYQSSGATRTLHESPWTWFDITYLGS